jgi:aryl-alcohol dehydrogenase-like predicted oxidoreductase
VARRPEGTRQLAQWSEPPVHDVEKLYDIVEVLVEVAGDRGVSAAQVALAWLLTRPAVCTVVIGARTESQLTDNLKAAALPLSSDELAKIEKASRPPLLYPFWHQVSTAADRFGPADLAAYGDHIDRNR